MDAKLRRLAAVVPGFLPELEGLALHQAALSAPRGPLLEVGSYCGKSAVYLGAAARERGGLLFSVDHHRGSEEHQPGEEYHDPALVDAEGRVDTLPRFRETLALAGLEGQVVVVVGRSAAVAAAWRLPLAMVFLDGGHSLVAAEGDYAGWAPRLAPAGLLAIHDVFPDPADGGRPPYLVYQRALAEGYRELSATGSLRVLRAPISRSAEPTPR